MKKFKFSLQKLYEVKASQEQQKRIELKDLEKMREALYLQLVEHLSSFDKQKKDYKEKCENGIGRDELNNYGNYFGYLTDEIMAVNEKIAACDEQVAQCRQELLALINEQKVLDRIREEQLREYLAEVQKANDKEIEDFMQSRM